MSSLQRFSYGSGLALGDARAVAKGNSRNQVSRMLRENDIDIETDIAVTKSDAYGTVVAAGATNVVRVAKLMEQLELTAPAVSGDLAYLRTMFVVGTGEFIEDFRKSLRRI